MNDTRKEGDARGLTYNPGVASFFCYIVECADGTLYTGWTTDLERRLREHNAGRGAQYTRSRRPVRLTYVEPVVDRATAMRRERVLKALPRRCKLAIIQSSSAPIRSPDSRGDDGGICSHAMDC